MKNTNLVTRGTFKLGNHQITAEWLLGRSESAKRFSENQISSVPSTSNITLPNGSTTPNPFRSLAYPSTGAGYARVFNALVGTFPELAVNNGLPVSYTHLDVYKRQQQHRHADARRFGAARLA